MERMAKCVCRRKFCVTTPTSHTFLIQFNNQKCLFSSINFSAIRTYIALANTEQLLHASRETP